MAQIRDFYRFTLGIDHKVLRDLGRTELKAKLMLGTWIRMVKRTAWITLIPFSLLPLPPGMTGHRRA
jgi:hypothetical protein